MLRHSMLPTNLHRNPYWFTYPTIFTDIWKKTWIRVFLALILAIGNLAYRPAEQPVQAATLTVTNTNNSGAGSLRQAIADANPGDTITFNLTYPATITLASEISIGKDLTITGPGVASLSISGNNATRIFRITAGTVRISKMTLKNGRMKGSDAANNTPGTVSGLGGAVYIDSGAGMTVTDAVFDSNSAIGGHGGSIATTGAGGGGGAGGAEGQPGALGGGGGGGASSSGGGAGGLGGGGGGSDHTDPGGLGGGGLGGNGGSGHLEYGAGAGGGGAGLGGAIFIDAGGALGLKNVSFTNNSATGGNGGTVLETSFVRGAGGGGGAGAGSAVFNNQGSLCIQTGVTFSGGILTAGSPGTGRCGFGGTCPGPAGAGQAVDSTPGYYNYSGDSSCAVWAYPPTSLSFTPTSLNENQPTGALAGTFTTTDPDAGDTFTYTLVAGVGSTDNASFNVSGSTLVTAAILDYEAKSSYSVRVRTTDSYGRFLENTFTITINNVNEAPSNINLTNNSLAENQAGGTTIGSLSSVDAESATQAHSYTLVNPGGACSGVDNASFSISGSTLSSAATYDHETKSSYTICMRSTDNGVPALSFDKQFTIQVTDVNEAPTNLTLSNNHLAENLSASSTVGSFSTADPDDGDTAAYALVNPGGACSGADNGAFSLAGNTLQTQSSFNYEAKSSYAVCVQTSDGGTPALTYTKPFTILVDDVNETPTAIALSSNQVDELQPINTAVGDLSTSDPDAGQSFAYTLVNPGGACSGADNTNFNLNAAALRTSAVFDYEDKGSYTVCVRTTDNGSPASSFDQQFTIQVQNVNEAPTDLSLSGNHLNENQLAGTTIGTLSTTDPDAGHSFTYTFDNMDGVCSGADNASFQISGATLASNAVFDHETKASYTVCIRTTDDGAPAYSYAEQFTIQVDDVNEAPTAISLTNAAVNENLPAGTSVGTLSASDWDEGESFTYQLVNPGGACSGADNASFTLAGGDLLTTESFDHESKSSYNICVRATDSGTPALTFDQAYTISVVDLNETPENINLSNSSVDELQAAGASVGSFSTVEPDDGQSHAYSLVNPGGACSGVDNAFFTIAGAELQTAAEFNYETKNSYTICVRTTDDGAAPLSFDKQFTVSVSNVNELPALDRTLPDHDLIAGTPFSYTFPADTFSDPDGDPFTYSAAQTSGDILPGWLTFDPGTRTFAGTPNRAVVLQVRLTADDGHGENVSDTFTLTIIEVEGNHNPVQIKPVPNAGVQAEVPFTFTFPADAFVDRDGDPISYQARLGDGSALPAWLSFDAATRTFSGTAGVGHAGVHTIRLIVLDGIGGETTVTFEIGVDVNLAPVLNQPIPDQAVIRSQPWTFQFAPETFTEPDGDPITYSAGLSGGGALPSWLTFDAGMRTFSGTPPADDPTSVYEISVSATDGLPGHTAQDVFRLTPWTFVDTSNNLPTGSQILFTAPEDEGPASVPQATVRLFTTVDVTITYDEEPITELDGGGIQVCFNISPEQSSLVGGDLSRLVIGTSHAGGPWQLLPTTIETDPTRICAPADEFSLFDIFVTPAREEDISSAAKLPDTGFTPHQVSPVPAQPEGARYAQFDGVWVEIPALEVNIPIVGVPLRDGEWDVTWLWGQAGWLQGSAFPGLEGNSLLTGHVYNSDGRPGPFAGLGNLSWGDRIIVHMYGIEYVYEVRTVDLEVSQYNRQALKHEETPWLTLITCRGYDADKDSYRWRTVVRAVLIEIE